MTNTVNPSPAPTSDELMREKRLQRNLKIVVATLGAMILIGLGAVAVRVVGLATGAKPASTAAPATAVSTPGGDLAIELPAGAKVVSVSLSGNRLAVHHESPAGTGIAILDLDTGRRVADVKTTAAVPRN
jgi:hypothetical protein